MKTNDELIEELKAWGWSTEAARQAFTHEQMAKIRDVLTQKDAEAAEERKRIENNVLAPLYEKIDGWYKDKHDIIGQGALASVFEEALQALTPRPTEDTSGKTN